ncbi:MAG: DUF1552 domain-containing protein [Myxococcota bacterium]|nr:DUF1552 domain-containing protein [Myxococcota bacterium]
MRLSRRTFLGGAGAVVALPMLDAMMPSIARADAPTRLITIVFPHGIRPSTWHPTGAGSSWSLSEDLAALERHKSKLISIGGLRRSEPKGPGDHPLGYGSLLTQANLEPGSRRNTISFDQLAAQHLGGATPRVPFLPIAMERHGHLGGNDGGFDTFLGSYLSWTEAGPVPPLMSPADVFDRLFAGIDPDATHAQSEERRRRSRSLLDWVRSDLSRVSGRVGVADRARLDEYATGLRDLERSIFAEGETAVCEVGGAPEDSALYPTRLDQIFALTALAARCDITRNITINLGDVYSSLRPRHFGVPMLAGVRDDGLHTISHESQEEHSVVNQWWALKLAELLDALDAIPEDGGTALDNSIVLFMSEMEFAQAHHDFNMPTLWAGSAGGRVVTDRRIVAPDDTPTANLYTSVLQLLGAPVDRFGAFGDGPLSGLV